MVCVIKRRGQKYTTRTIHTNIAWERKIIWFTNSNRSRQFSERRRAHVTFALRFLHRRQCTFALAKAQKIVSRETMRLRSIGDRAWSAQRQAWAWCSATRRLRFDCARTTKGNSAQSKENGEEGRENGEKTKNSGGLFGAQRRERIGNATKHNLSRVKSNDWSVGRFYATHRKTRKRGFSDDQWDCFQRSAHQSRAKRQAARPPRAV